MVSNSILISRTDAIGDVMLTLPLAGILRKHLPNAKIYWLGQPYARPVVEACQYVDGFLERAAMLQKPEEWANLRIDTILHVSPDHAVATLADRLKIANRIGTSHRSFHWLRCNHLVNLGRKGSNLHEAQLNAKLLGPMGLPDTFTLEELSAYYGLVVPPYQGSVALPADKFKLVLHPKSSGSAREWPLANFLTLAQTLPQDRFEIYVSGLAGEGELVKAAIPALFELANVHDNTGQMSLPEFISFVQAADGLLAASTGPLHIAAALGKKALGLYPPIKPMHPGRWAPVGPEAGYLVRELNCRACRYTPEQCACMAHISVESVSRTLLDWLQVPIEER